MGNINIAYDRDGNDAEDSLRHPKYRWVRVLNTMIRRKGRLFWRKIDKKTGTTYDVKNAERFIY